jgi:hypothetical protein
VRPIAFFLLLASGVCASADIDEDLAKLADLRKRQAELKKEEEALAEKLRQTHQSNHEKLAAAGVIAPGPPPPAPPPKPVDELKKKLRAAFEADGSDRDAGLQLAALYREAAKLSQSPDVPSTAELLRRVREAAASLVPGALPAVRKVVAEELRLALGKSSDEALSAEERKAAAELFAKLAELLEGF